MNEVATNPPAGWENILSAGETILWQGRPAGGIHFTPKMIVPFIFGLAFAGFAVFWMSMASRTGGSFWMFGLIHFSVGIGMAFGTFLWPAITARRTWYTLTDQRVFIATKSLVGIRKLNSYPIKSDTRINTVSGRYTTINFAAERHTGSKGRSYSTAVGFRDLPDGDKVYRILDDIRKSAHD